MSNTAEHAFDTPGPVELYVENGRGSVTVTATDTDVTKVYITGRHAEEARVGQAGAAVRVIAPKVRGFTGVPSLDIEIGLPAGSGLTAKLGSAELTTDGELGVVRVRSGSGAVRLDRVAAPVVVTAGSGTVTVVDAAAELKLRSGSGTVEVEHAAATTSISTGSGDVRLGRADGPVAVKTGSGDLSVAEADTDVTLRTGSGRLTIGTVRRGRVTLKGASGDIRIGIPPGTPVWTDIRSAGGRVWSDLPSVGEPEPGADHVEVRATTASGDVALLPG